MTARSAVGTELEGVADLCLPTDWCEILIDDGDDPRAHVERVLRETWPTCPEHLRTGSEELLLRWREDLLARGAVSHGVVSAQTDEGEPVRWHVLTGVVRLPATSDVDLTAVLSRLVVTSGREALLVERFETELGLGLGLIAQPEVPAPVLAGVSLASPDGSRRLGAAAALSYAPGAGLGLVVVGMSVSPVQVLELAALVAVIVGRSRLVLDPRRHRQERR